MLSDTHSHIDDRILAYAKEADEIWHAGDIGDLAVTDQLASIKPLRAVYGNIDGAPARVTFSENNIFTCEGVCVLITHIAGPAGKYSSRVQTLLKKEKPDLLVCGHSHILKVKHIGAQKMLHLNPGAAGVHGFHSIRTMLRFEIQQGKLQNMEVIELGKRGKGLA